MGPKWGKIKQNRLIMLCCYQTMVEMQLDVNLLVCAPIINYELVLSIIIIVGKI